MKKAFLTASAGALVCGLAVTQLHGQVSAPPSDDTSIVNGQIKEMLTVVGEAPNDASTRLRLGFALESVGRDGEAQRWFDEARKIDPGLYENVMAGARGEMAQYRTTCPETTGPDVIVGDLPNVSRYGPSGSLVAYSVGTTSCNVGTQNVLWQDGNNKHPVIAQNLYRLKGGRFEMIGESWLKHGFTALTGSICCSCSGQGGTVLGVGCSDPYDSSLNGSQGRLGPRYQVNAATGVYTWPHPTPGSGTLNGRCQVHVSDVDPAQNSGAQYFVEGHYVTADDATAGNKMNNASYRTCNVGAAPNYNLSLTGSTQRELPAITAWRVADPGVTLVNVDVPSDGRFILGYRVTDNGDGTWHYEYALHNLNSDRSGQSFSVPVPAGVVVTNVGFHDVDYHDGDGVGGITQDGTDWASSMAGGALTWQTQTFATNQNANALHWGTLYNFRFDANYPPMAANITLGLFKPGSPGSMTAAAMAPTGPAPCPADLDGDGMVGSSDLGFLLGSWGGGGAADLDGSGDVGSPDLAILLGSWGACP